MKTGEKVILGVALIGGGYLFYKWWSNKNEGLSGSDFGGLISDTGDAVLETGSNLLTTGKNLVETGQNASEIVARTSETLKDSSQKAAAFLTSSKGQSIISPIPSFISNAKENLSWVNKYSSQIKSAIMPIPMGIKNIVSSVSNKNLGFISANQIKNTIGIAQSSTGKSAGSFSVAAAALSSKGSSSSKSSSSKGSSSIKNIVTPSQNLVSQVRQQFNNKINYFDRFK
jgi:hypothetical protein